MTDIKIDVSSLPQHEQYVRCLAQINREEELKVGYYLAEDQMFVSRLDGGELFLGSLLAIR